jgi:hypothetical protein
MDLTGLPRYTITIEQQAAHIGTAAELTTALDVLQGQHDRAVLVQLRPYLPQIIVQAEDLFSVMRSLSADDQSYLIEALGSHLAGILHEAYHLRDLLATLADAQVEIALLHALGTAGLRSLVLTATELGEVLEWVYGECDALTLDLIGIDYVRRLCRHAEGLSAVLHSLDSTLQDDLLEQLGWEHTASLVRDGRDLACLLRSLPPTSSESLLRHYTPSQLKQIIGNAHDWDYLYQRLEPAEAAHITQLLDLH